MVRWLRKTTQPGTAIETSTAVGARRHVPALDAVRGLAILLVLAYHFRGDVGPASALDSGLFALLRAGGLGVDLFFVLSGFLITGILHDTPRDHRYFRDFYIRRTLRIFPLYYATLFLAFVVLPRLAPAAARTYEHSIPHQFWLWTYLANVFVAVKEAYVLTGFNHFWSLAVEEHFYLVWPFVIYMCNRQQAMRVCVACFIGALAFRLGLVLSGDHPISPYVLTPCRMDALAAGGWLALAIRGSRGLQGLEAPARIGFVPCAAVAAACFCWKSGGGPMDAFTLVVRPALSTWLFGTVLILALAAAPGGWHARFWNSRILRFFGKYSYGLYVFHYPLISTFEAWFRISRLTSLTGSPVLARVLFIGLCTGCTLILALLSWNLFEKHVLKFKDRLAGHAPPAPDGATGDVTGQPEGRQRLGPSHDGRIAPAGLRSGTMEVA